MRPKLFIIIGFIGVFSWMIVGADEPIFVRWLVAEDPGDETIRNYWERSELGELDAPALVDLGTMLFYRGFPKDALRMYKRALDLDSNLYEAWFRLGLVEHSQANVYEARKAYKRCLKQLTGHGWCNFYLALLEENEGHSSDALHHYRRAFKFAPELADPRVNPEVLSSDLAIAAELREFDRKNFNQTMPLRFLEPGKVKRVRSRFEPEETDVEPEIYMGNEEVDSVVEPTRQSTTHPVGQPTPKVSENNTRSQRQPRVIPVRQAPRATPKPAVSAESGGVTPREPRATPYGMPEIANVSPEAHLELRWPRLWEFVSVFV